MQILAKKKADVPMLISDKVDFKVKSIIRDTGGHITMLKVNLTKRCNNLKFICPQ